MTLGAVEAAIAHRRRPLIATAIDFDCASLAVYEANFSAILKRARNADLGLLFEPQLESPLTGSEKYLRRSTTGIEVLLAGPPCQGHSDLNNWTRRRDPRNALYLQAIRAVRVLRPRVAVIENVPTVIHDHGRVIPAGTMFLERLGYVVHDITVDAKAFGVPQRRKRHFLIALYDDKFDFISELKDECKHLRATTVRDAIEDLNDKRELTSIFDAPSRMTDENASRAHWLFANSEYDLPDRLRPLCHRNGHSYRSVYGRMKWDEPAQTITTGFGCMGQGRYVHPAVPRTITPHEAARLQTFPDFFDFGACERRTALSRMIGNAVPPRVSAVLLAILLKAGVFDK
jgi:DNA (cytosine-5)-methyltransferase 1